MKQSHCVFPAATEDELVTLPGEEPGTALRVLADTGREGYVRLQQLAYTEGLGWYAQKSMVIPRDVLEALIPQLRKAMCLMPPKRKAEVGGPIPFMRVTGDEDDAPVRRVGS